MPFTMPNFPEYDPSGMSQISGLIQGLLKGAQAAPDMYKSMVEAQYAPQTAKATADYKEAMARYLNSPNQQLKYVSQLGRTFLEPGIVKAIMAAQGKDISDEDAQTLADTVNTTQQPSSIPNQPQQTTNNGATNSSDNITNAYHKEQQKLTTSPKMLNSANAAQIVYNEINDIDTKPLETFAGLGGKIKLGEEKGKGILRSFGVDWPASKDFREYNKYISVNQTAIMDAIRQMLQTSVQPGYVYKTIGTMVDPDSPAWSDPEQVRNAIDTLKSWSKQYAGEQTENIEKGVPESLEESEKRHKKYTKNTESSAEKKIESSTMNTDEVTDENGDVYVYENGKWKPK